MGVIYEFDYTCVFIYELIIHLSGIRMLQPILNLVGFRNLRVSKKSKSN